jgi:hypothetical protein
MLLDHFSALLIFSLCLSVIFGITQRSQPKLMIRFGIYVFALCIGGTIAASWLMVLIKR